MDLRQLLCKLGFHNGDVHYQSQIDRDIDCRMAHVCKRCGRIKKIRQTKEVEADME
jgi:hypothetical protein